MKSNLEEVSSVQKKIKITVPQENVNKAFNDAYKRYQKKSRIHGFRAGKAPLYLIKNNYGSQISYEVSDALLDKSLKSAILEHKLEPVSRPHVSDFNEPAFDKEFSFTALIDVFSKIPLKETYKGLEVSYPVQSFNEDEVSKELKAIRRHYVRTAAIEDQSVAIAAEGHLAVVSYDSSFSDAKVARLCAQSSRVAMGLEELPKEIEAALVGMKKGEKKEIETTLSIDPEFSEKKLKISISIEDVLSFSLPELNDDFAKELKQESLEELTGLIRKNIEQKVENSNRTSKEAVLLETLSGKVSFDIPPAITSQVIDGMIHELYGQSEGVKTLLKDEKFREKLLPEATKRAKNTLLLWEVAKAEKIDVSSAEIKDYIKKSLGNGADDAKVEDLYAKSQERVKETLVFEKVIEVIASFADLKEEVKK